jgi:hypothetical protein
MGKAGFSLTGERREIWLKETFFDSHAQ